jgi:hypothetical protein
MDIMKRIVVNIVTSQESRVVDRVVCVVSRCIVSGIEAEGGAESQSGSEGRLYTLHTVV